MPDNPADQKAKTFEDALTHLPCDGPSECLYEAHRIDCPSDVVKRLRVAHDRALLLARLAQAEIMCGIGATRSHWSGALVEMIEERDRLRREVEEMESGERKTS